MISNASPRNCLRAIYTLLNSQSEIAGLLVDPLVDLQVPETKFQIFAELRCLSLLTFSVSDPRLGKVQFLMFTPLSTLT